MSSGDAKRRRDGRSALELRPMTAEFSTLSSCDGSARLKCGDTDVIVGVQGPRPPKGMRFEDATGCLIEVLLQPAYGQTGPREKELEGLVRDAVDCVVAKSAMPRTVLTVVVQVLHDAGSLLSAILNCCSLALVDAGVPLIATLTAANGVACLSAGEAERSVEPLTLDPTREEEEHGTSRKGIEPGEGDAPPPSIPPVRFTQVSAWRGDRQISLLFKVSGPAAPVAISKEHRSALVEGSDAQDDVLAEGNVLLLRNACATVLAFQRLAVARKIERDSLCYVGETAAVGLATTAVTIGAGGPSSSSKQAGGR